jgi:Tfp pilus assembly protein PilN
MTTIKKIYLFLAGFGLAAIALVGLLIVPLWWEIDSSSQSLQLQKTDASLFDDQAAQIDQFNKDHQAYVSDLEKINAAFIDPGNPVDFIEFLERAAEASGTHIKISLLPPQTQNPGTTSFQVLDSDSFPTVVRFVNSVENGPYLLTVKSVAMRTFDKDISVSGPSGNVDASMVVDVFSKQQ